jgi:hypothetical protein
MPTSAQVLKRLVTPGNNDPIRAEILQEKGRVMAIAPCLGNLSPMLAPGF